MFSSPHSHDAMRRLLKTAVGVLPKRDNPASFADGSTRRTLAVPNGDPKTIAPGPQSEDKGQIRT